MFEQMARVRGVEAAAVGETEMVDEEEEEEDEDG